MPGGRSSSSSNNGFSVHLPLCCLPELAGSLTSLGVCLSPGPFVPQEESGWRGRASSSCQGTLQVPPRHDQSHRSATIWPQLEPFWSGFFLSRVVRPPGPGCPQCPSGTRENCEDLRLRPGQRHHAWFQLRVKRQRMSRHLHCLSSRPFTLGIVLLLKSGVTFLK